MKNRIFVSILCLIMLIIASQSVSAQNQPMVLVFYDDYAPFSFIENREDTGMLVDILTEAIENRLKLELEIQMGPWARMQALVKNGTADGFCTNATPERREYTVPGNVPTISFPYKIFINKNSSKLDALKAVRNIEDLRDGAKAGRFSLAAFIGDGWTKANFDDYGVRIDYAPDMENIIKKIAYMRTDAYVNNAIVERYSQKLLVDQLKREGKINDVEKIQNIVELDTVIYDAQFYLCIGKDSPYLRYMDQIDRTLKEMQNDGFIDRVINTYK